MAVLVLLLISATWLLGLMAVNSDVLTFHYLFAILSCLQVVYSITQLLRTVPVNRIGGLTQLCASGLKKNWIFFSLYIER